jgi:hypothetical protein
MIIQALLASCILFSFNWFTIVLGVLSLLPVAIYPFAKRFTWWPQVFLGIAFNWGALLAWAAHTGSLSLSPALLYSAGIAWTLFYDTIYAHQDLEDDALIGVKSTARLFARQHTALATHLSVNRPDANAVSYLCVNRCDPTLSSNPFAFLFVFMGVCGFIAFTFVSSTAAAQYLRHLSSASICFAPTAKQGSFQSYFGHWRLLSLNLLLAPFDLLNEK